jgi:AcrR family transcriptional regulator
MAVTRQSLTEATIAVLENSSSPDGLTVDVLANTLRMSKSTLYKYFEGRDDLLYAAVEHLAIQTDVDLANIASADSPEAVFNEVATVYGRYVDRMPTALLTVTGRRKLPLAAQLRLDNVEERLGERVFRAAMGLGASSYVAQGIRAGYEGLTRFLRTAPQNERHSCMAELTSVFLKALKP